MFNSTVAQITLRATVGRRRALLFALAPLVLIVLAGVLKASHPPDADWPARTLGDFGFTVLVPLTALVIGTSVLGAEIDEGSVVHLLATPVRRSSVIVTKWLVAACLTMIFAALPELIAGIIATGRLGSLAAGLFLGALAGSLIYTALFVLISVVTTRAIAVGLLYVVIWEGLLANFVGGARILSIGHYSLGVANGIAHDNGLGAGLSVTTSVILGVIVTVFALVLAVRRLARFTIQGEAA